MSNDKDHDADTHDNEDISVIDQHTESHEEASHGEVHESPWSMTFPLVFQ